MLLHNHMLLYNIIIHLIGFAIKIASLKKEKAKLWVEGRKNWKQQLSVKLKELNSNNIAWFHCSSYGEFEQGKPLIENFKLKYPHYKILLTFYSPSGYQAFKNWSGADIVFYLPLDTTKNATDFVNLVKPTIVFFIKYEFWLNVLAQLKAKSITTYIVSAVFKPRHPFFKWYGSAYRKALSTFTLLFIQDDASGKLLDTIGIKNYKITGDTRFDRVLEIKKNNSSIPIISQFKATSKLVIAGSTWPKDDDILLAAYTKLKQQAVKLVLVPHEIGETEINTIIKKIKALGLTYSLYKDEQLNYDADILIVNTIGLLSKMYYYADCSYVGGGFSDGLHNTLEPAVFGNGLVFYGNNYVNFVEAVELVKLGCAKQVINDNQLVESIQSFLFNSTLKLEITKKSNLFFEKNANSTQKIIDSINLK